MTQRAAPDTHPSESTPSARQALDLLDELDDYLNELKDETGDSNGGSPAATVPSQSKPADQPPPETRKPRSKEVSGEKAPTPSKPVAPAPAKQPTRQQQAVKHLSKKAKQVVGDKPAGPRREGSDHQRRHLQAHQHKIDKAWRALKREKAALIQQQLQLKADRQTLEKQLRRSSGGEPADERRLDLYRDKLQERYNSLRASEAVVDLARQQYAELLEQRETLLEVKHYLASAEQEMVRRWSLHRGVGLVGGAVSCLLFLLLFSYHFGHRIVDPVWRASTVVGVTAAVFDESRYGDAWLTEQHQLMVGDELLAESIRLGAQRGVRIFPDVAPMREALTDGLAISQPAPGRIQLEFRHTNPDLSVGVLESLCRALVNYHTQEDRVAGRPNSMRIYEAAARDPAPVEDARMMASGITLGVATVVVVVVSLVLRLWLARSVRVFEETGISEIDDLECPEHWPKEPAVKKPKSSKQSQAGIEEVDSDACTEEETVEVASDDTDGEDVFEARYESDQGELADHTA